MIILRLAEKFRRPDVDAFLASVGSNQITEWLMYYKIIADDEGSRKKRDALAQGVRKRGRHG